MSGHDDDRVFAAFANLNASADHHEAFADLHRLMGLIEYALDELQTFDPAECFANDLGAAAALCRTYVGLQAASSLAVLGFTTEARVIVRSVYETAGLARTIAKNPELADKWLAKGEWIPDRVSRAFVMEMYDGDERFSIPYQAYYRQSSGDAHPTARSTLPYLIADDGTIKPALYPTVKGGELRVLAAEITALGIFTAFCLRNALADPDVFSPAWHQELTAIAREFTGLSMAHLDADWTAREARHARITAVPLPIDQLQHDLNANPRSVRNRLRQGEAESGG